MSNVDKIVNYLHDNYYDDGERMAKIKMIAALATQPTVKEYDIPSLIDKVALFNSIEKSYPPKVPTATKIKREIIKGVGFIMYGGWHD